VIDDHAGARAATSAILGECGCELIGTSTLLDGLAALGDSTPDFAVLDATSPGDDPRAIAGQLRADPRLAAVPVILLTTFAAQVRQEVPLTAIAFKPVRRRQLREAALRLLNGRPGSGTQRIPRRFNDLPVLIADHRLGNLRVLSGVLTDLGCRVDVLIRPDDIIHDDDSLLMAEVERKAFRGSDFLYTLKLPGGRHVLAQVDSHHNHAIGEKIGIRLGVDHVVAFRK